MPRTARAAVGGLCYHVINRGNARGEVFHKPEDYAAFWQLLQEAADRVRMRLLAYCLMPNHFHLALWPRQGRMETWEEYKGISKRRVKGSFPLKISRSIVISPKI